ncbi:DUF3073 domain-containing protein [Streptosporangium sp. NBC_01639]|uniref:DUF3073 family protein n=1 Tax=unclassified Streptosporangium TaxID=2632669 RepID=UPI002DDA6EE3|nr:DUF3073 family protein [Streptosporangium sp. NBC_01756]WSC87122.1 DUF3073 domain-containing protein [Streptosporangium sp. NBC_01756]WTD54188.1 DUF3073 domain-containing protein [Streptosporangium sp. NBC_01639]
MGRGRAKAKQTKVARELKYGSHDIDLARLREELSAGDRLARNDEADAPAEESADR